MDSIFTTLLSLVSIISPCIVFATSCYFLAKKSAVEAILMTIGSGIVLLTTLFNRLLVPFLVNNRHLAYTEISQYYAVIGIISLVSSLCFAAGFLILVINTVKKNAVIHDQFPKSID